MPDKATNITDAAADAAKARALPAAAATSKGDAPVKADAAARMGPAAKASVPAAPEAAAKAPAPAAANAAPKPADKPATPAASALAVPDAKDAAASADEATLFGRLDADERIRANIENSERTLWAGALIMTLVYASLITGQVLIGDPLLQAAQERERLRRGQGAPPSISVELVPDPDKTSKTKKWREGAAQQTPTPNNQPPQPQQMASLAQPEVSEREAQKERADKPRSENSPMLLDLDSLVDAAAADLKQEIDRHYDKKKKRRRQQQARRSGGGMQVRGIGASGRSDPFTRSVIAALMKTRPGPFALWGRVLVSFEISPSGRLNYVHLLRSSGNSALDQAAIDAIHKARFNRPPPGLSSDERTYIIDYIFG